jgi:hypothetical protein
MGTTCLTLVQLDVLGRPASYSSAAEAPWKAAVRAAISEAGGAHGPDDCVIAERLGQLRKVGVGVDPG